VRAFEQKESDAPEVGTPVEHAQMDAVRAWLANGIHTFAIDPRRRLGGHGRARQRLADDRRSGNAPPGAWESLASALDRHTIRSGMTELSPDERRVITLAFLEGHTNREIAAMLGVSVSTVRRRLWAALKRLDAYINRTRTWLSTILVLGTGYMIGRIAKLGRSANTDWTHKVASTLAVGAVTAAAIGLTAISPDSTGPRGASTPTAVPAIAAGPSVGAPASPTQLSDLGPAPTARIVIADRSNGVGPIDKVIPNVPMAETQPGTGSRHPNQGCDGNPTNAPPPVPVGSPTSHPTGAPVSHPTAGGCRA
jgi:RNA polymerase sigma factor (sigma-70 family)